MPSWPPGSAPPTTQLGRQTRNALTFDLDQSTGAGQEDHRAELAEGLTDLGYSIEKTHADGRFEIAGVPRRVIDAFSTRSAEIEAAMEAHDLGTPGDNPHRREIEMRQTRGTLVNRAARGIRAAVVALAGAAVFALAMQPTHGALAQCFDDDAEHEAVAQIVAERCVAYCEQPATVLKRDCRDRCEWRYGNMVDGATGEPLPDFSRSMIKSCKRSWCGDGGSNESSSYLCNRDCRDREWNNELYARGC